MTKLRRLAGLGTMASDRSSASRLPERAACRVPGDDGDGRIKPQRAAPMLHPVLRRGRPGTRASDRKRSTNCSPGIGGPGIGGTQLGQRLWHRARGRNVGSCHHSLVKGALWELSAWRKRNAVGQSADATPSADVRAILSAFITLAASNIGRAVHVRLVRSS